MFTKLNTIARRQHNTWIRDLALGAGLAIFLAMGASVLSGAEQRAAHAKVTTTDHTVEVQAAAASTAQTVCVASEDSVC